jgi:hypothetical protein
MSSADIQPFRIAILQDDLDDLRQRLARARFPGELPDTGWSRGMPVDTVQELAIYWGTTYDWRQQEARMNEFPQFITEIDGQPIHFLHVRSPEPDALPLILTHGYPSSFVEYLTIVALLTDPRAHGGDPADAFHVVVPSLPGLASPIVARGGMGVESYRQSLGRVDAPAGLRALWRRGR